MNIRALLAEAVGTFVLVGVGSLGIATALAASQSIGLLALLVVVPIAFGFGLMAAIAIAGDASGGHFNPAVTFAAVLDGRVSWMTGIAYVVAQAVGAIGASLFMLLVLSSEFVKATLTQPQDFGTGPDMYIRAFAVEIVLTTIFVAVILTVAAKHPGKAIFVIPITLMVIHMVGIPISGASVNPIRSLAPALVTGTYDGLWVYLTAPFIGSLLGWVLYKVLNPADADDDGNGDADDDMDIDDDAMEPA